MKDGLLDDIIHLEKQIQAEVAAEETRAAAWRDRELAALDAAATRLKATEEQRLDRALSAARDKLRREADALESSAADACRRLESLDDDVLRRVLHRHLPSLLPGGDHDHPHGES